LAIVFILFASRIRAISLYAFPLMGLVFVVACNAVALVVGEMRRSLGSCYLVGMKSILPAIITILMAMSVKLIITKDGILDTILIHGGWKNKRSGT
jgi:uncharacterized ion transporter superfamily protein YfcC